MGELSTSVTPESILTKEQRMQMGEKALELIFQAMQDSVNSEKAIFTNSSLNLQEKGRKGNAAAAEIQQNLGADLLQMLAQTGFDGQPQIWENKEK